MKKIKNVLMIIFIILLIIISVIYIYKYFDNKKDIELTSTNVEIKKRIISTGIMQKSNNLINNTDEKKVPKYEDFVYGKSVNGRDLICHSISPESYSSTILLVFAIHGYEDLYDKDAKMLVEAGEFLIEQYKNSDVSNLANSRLLIVSCANPDGLYDGYSNNGFGRCNANGIDLNRDFDVNYTPNNDLRNYTSKAFSGVESKALADLVKKYKPNVVLDFHGWENCTIGNFELAQIFKENMSLKYKTDFNNECNGYFSHWSSAQGIDSLLVEFKDDNISRTDFKLTIDKVLETF